LQEKRPGGEAKKIVAEEKTRGGGGNNLAGTKEGKKRSHYEHSR